MRSKPFRTGMLAALFLFCLLLDPRPAHSGIKLGMFAPTNKDYPNNFSVGLDGYIGQDLQLGFDVLYVPNITGDKYIYYKYDYPDGYSHAEVTEYSTDLSLFNFLITTRYFLLKHVYAGVGAGGFQTTTTHGHGNTSMGGDVEEPWGYSLQGMIGFSQRPSNQRQHVLFYGEVKYLYQKGQGTEEGEDGTEVKFDTFNGVNVSLGVSF
jgi:hypothetical protein